MPLAENVQLRSVHYEACNYISISSKQANIRAKKREEFRQQLQEKTVEDISESSFFDPRISAKSNIRNKRALKFHEPGKFQQLADRMRMKVRCPDRNLYLESIQSLPMSFSP